MTIAKEFFLYTVKPTVKEYLDNPRDIRLGRLAAIVVYHMIDYLALDEYEGQDRKVMNDRVDAMRDAVIEEFPEFSLIRDIADATKHARLSVPKKTPRLLYSSEQVTRSDGIFHAPFGQGVFAEAVIVYAELDSGEHKPLEPVLCGALHMIEQKLGLVGE